MYTMEQIKRIVCILLVFPCIVLLVSCSNENISTRQSSNIEEDSNEIKINIQVGNENFTAILFDNPSTQSIIDMLPMTLNMEDMNENEKYYFLENNIPTNSEKLGQINKGDLMLYGADCIVLFYKSFSSSYSYTKLGYVENTNNLINALGNGYVEARFSLVE